MYFFPKRKDGRFEARYAYSVETFPYSKLPNDIEFLPLKRKNYILPIFATLDIESTTIFHHNTYEGFMYIWQMCVNDICVEGRTWKELMTFLANISSLYTLNNHTRMVIYVHNLGYEFQFMRDYLTQYFNPMDVFAVKNRIPLTVRCHGFEFRCSYKLTNMSLEKACQNELGCPYIKHSGDMDYSIVRTPSTPLPHSDYDYAMQDVLCQYHMILAKMKNEGDNLATIPLTSTSYVRRECRAACKADSDYMNIYLKNKLTKPVYTLLKEAGRGGDTSANYRMAGQEIANVHSFDIKSSYPFQLCTKKFPMRRFFKYSDNMSEEELNGLIEDEDNACLFRCAFKNLKAKPDAIDLYLSFSKSTGFSGKKRIANGRVMFLEGASFTFTDIDWKIIQNCYTWDEVYITSIYVSKYDYIPSALREKILEYFHLKCELEYKISICTDPEEKENLEYLYGKMKNRLNGIFGMCYTDPVHDIIEFNNNPSEDEKVWQTLEGDIIAELKKCGRQNNTFLVYAWGVWTTAHARNHLQWLISLCGEGSAYWDTDSDKCIDPDFTAINAANEQIKALSQELGAFSEVNGHRYYMGVFEHETDSSHGGAYPLFKTLGAKKYAYIHPKKGLQVTISGVQKKAFYKGRFVTSSEELGSISNFKAGFTFHATGGLNMHFNDTGFHTIVVNGEEIQTASNIGAQDSTYKIGVDKEYAKLLGLNLYKETLD